MSSSAPDKINSATNSSRSSGSAGRIFDMLRRKAFIKCTHTILTGEVIAKIVKCKTAIGQPCFRLLGSD